MLTLMKPKVKPRILGLILGRNVAGPESPSSNSPPPHTHLQAGGGGGLSAAPLSTAVLRACTSGLPDHILVAFSKKQKKAKHLISYGLQSECESIMNCDYKKYMYQLPVDQSCRSQRWARFL